MALTTAHLVWWVLVIGLAASGVASSWGWTTRIMTLIEPGVYAVGITALAARWL